jgi:hypothetical protein
VAIVERVLACRVLGHRYRFRAEGAVLHWRCARCGAAGGSKHYPSAEQAERYAAALDRRDSDEIGERAPLLGLFPLRLWRALRRRSSPPAR